MSDMMNTFVYYVLDSGIFYMDFMHEKIETKIIDGDFVDM
jgi:hypothetical protein